LGSSASAPVSDSQAQQRQQQLRILSKCAC
jgi:hypothetical protein